MTRRKPTAVVTTTIPLTLNSFHRELVRQLQADFIVHLVSSPGTDLDEVSQSLGAMAHPISMARDISLAADAGAALRWLVLLLRLRPAIVVSATPKASLLSQLAAFLTRVPRRVYFVGGLRLEGAQGRSRRLLTAMERTTFSAATVAVANSPSLRQRALDLRLGPSEKIRTTVPGSSHGVDASHFTPREPDATLRSSLGLDPDLPVVGFVGRLTHDKGIDALVAAAALLESRGTRAQWLVVGSQIEPDSMRYAEKLAQVGSRIALVGSTKDVRPYFGLMDVHVLPSLREGFPNVVLEASAMEVPTVTTTATGAVDSVLPGRTGLVVPVEDGEALASAVESLLVDAGRRLEMGRAARRWVADEFDPAAVVASLLKAAR